MKQGVAHFRSPWKPIAAAALIAMVLGGITLRPVHSQVDQATDTSVKNPHWDLDACSSCHRMVGNKPQAIAAADVDRVCLTCHDGQHASAEVHPIDRQFKSDDHMTHPADWPLVDGKIGCQTCHDARQACKTTADNQPGNLMFLRTAITPDANGVQSRDFCQNCHQADQTARFNPHLMLGSRNQIIANRCLFCHEQVPPRDVMSRTGNAQLCFPQIVLCKSCHPHHKEILRGGHLDVKVKDDFAAYMRARELIGLIGEPSVQLLAQLKSQKARPTRMYLEPDGGVMCATCHNPHPEGLFPLGSVLSYRAMHVIDGHPISPVHEQSFCRNCHHL